MGANIHTCHSLYLLAKVNKLAEVAKAITEKLKEAKQAPKKYWIVIFQEPCETSRALEAFTGFYTKASAYIGPANPGYCDAASMLSKGWNKVSDVSV